MDPSLHFGRGAPKTPAEHGAMVQVNISQVPKPSLDITTSPWGDAEPRGWEVIAQWRKGTEIEMISWLSWGKIKKQHLPEFEKYSSERRLFCVFFGEFLFF